MALKDVAVNEKEASVVRFQTPEREEVDMNQEPSTVFQPQRLERKSEPVCDDTRTSVFEGHHLRSYIWEPDEGTPRALLCLCHGVHEHMGRYEKLIDHLKKEGILVFGIDLVGHGNSEGVRGHIDEIQSYATDVMRYAEDVKKRYRNIPMFLMGHSMGGLIAIICAIQSHIFKGLLLSSPTVESHPSTVGIFKKFVAKFLNVFAPLSGVLYINPDDISSLPDEARAYEEDPLVIHTLAKASWGSAMMSALDQYRSRLNELRLPLFIMHGSADQLVPMSASDLVYSSCSSKDKILEVFIDSRHEIFHDKEQQRARELACTWIKARLLHNSCNFYSK